MLNGEYTTMRNHLLLFTIIYFSISGYTLWPIIASEANSDAQQTERIKNAGKSLAENLYEESAIDVSIIQLISNPDKFDGKYVRLIGYVHLEFEGDAIFLHEDDYKYGLTRNGLWLNLTQDCCGKDIRFFNKKYVLVEGTFSAKNHGHMDLFSGAVDKIKRFQVWKVKKPE